MSWSARNRAGPECVGSTVGSRNPKHRYAACARPGWASVGVILAAVVLAAMPHPALAQDEQSGPPPPPRLKSAEDPPVLMNYAVLAVLLAVGVGANAIPSKRGHQD